MESDAVMFAKIMCPIDFSEHSQRALRFAALLARSFGAQMTLLHVNDPLLVAAAAFVPDQRPEEDTKAELHRLLNEAVAGDQTPVPDVTTLVTEGEPSEEIVKAADEHGIDLIVMGTHGLGGYRKLLIGSTTERVLRRTFVPVAAVPLAESTFSLEDSLRPGAGPVVAAVDFSEPSHHAARVAADVATTLELQLLLLHVLKPRRTLLTWRGQAAVHDKTRMTGARRQLEELASSLGVMTATQILVVTGHPADDIASAAIQRKASLITMGLRGEGGLFAPSPGSIAYHTLGLAPMPILAVPASKDAATARQSLRAGAVGQRP
jgi:nucleotide-binding universal stress UspA family protein